MKSTNKGKFTFQDFEKGLMLAGYIAPANANEVQEKRLLDEYDKQNSKGKQIIYFKRAVLAAEIVSELKDERTFGRVKFQKLVYLCENVAHMELSEERYKKFAAGPFDNRFMHSINSEFKKQKWFEVKLTKDGNYSRPQYFELEHYNKYKEFYKSYYSRYDVAIHRVISLLKYERTTFVELIATIFYSWKEILGSNQVFSKELMYERVYSWAKEKAKYSHSDIDSALRWMEEKRLTPTSI